MANNIPLGRQLPRTPPEVNRRLSFSEEEVDQARQNMKFNTPEIKTEPDDPVSMLKGMKGFRATAHDMECIQEMQKEKLLKKLQGDLEELKKSLNKEKMALELARATRDKAKSELKKFPSYEELAEWIKAVLVLTSPSTALEGRDVKSLLAMVTTENAQTAVAEMRIEHTRLRKMVANKMKKEAKESGVLEKKMASFQRKIPGLMLQLCDLKSELAQEEETFKALEMQINSQEAAAAEIKAVEADSSKDPQVTKSRAKSRGKGETKAVRFAEKLEYGKKPSQSTRSRSKSDSQSGRKQAAVAEAQNDGLRRSKRIASRS